MYKPTFWDRVAEALTGECRFLVGECCGVHGYRCKTPDECRRCGVWKDHVLGVVELPSSHVPL